MYLLVSISSKNIHKALSVWYLKAQTTDRAFSVYETDINQNFFEILNDIYSKRPKVIAFSCYIWNIELIKRLTIELKKLLPKTIIIAGGPEVSFNETNEPFDSLIIGAEASFLAFFEDYKNNPNNIKKRYYAKNKPFAEIKTAYTDEFFDSFKNEKITQIENRLLYYESSRGCPFNCSYCLSSADNIVEYLPLERVFNELKLLISTGAKCIKFVDRTFNANLKRAIAILNYIKSLDTDCTFHFEIAGDIASEEFFSVIEKMPKNRVQFEIGIQTVTEKALDAVNRKTNIETLFNNIKRLVSFKNCHIHIDLIAGLPFDSYEGILKSLDFCFNTGANMIQLGFLKLLKGSLLHKNSFNINFLSNAPYEITESEFFSFEELTILRKFDKIIDKFYNSGLYKNSLSYGLTLFDRPSKLIVNLADFLNDTPLSTISQKNAYLLLGEFLTKHGNKDLADFYIKLDALSFNPKGKRLGFSYNRNITIEKEYIKTLASKNILAEYFDFDKKIRVFDYETKDPITKSYLKTILEVDDE